MGQQFSPPRSRFFRDRPWYPFFCWLLLVFLGGVLGSLGGLLVGKVLYRLSYDYIVVPQEHQDWGLRFGLLVGAVLTAAQWVGRRSPYSLARPLLGLCAIGIITGICLGGGGLIAHQLYQAGLWRPESWKLPNPSRHAILVGAITGRNWGAGLGLTFTVLALRYYPRPG